MGDELDVVDFRNRAKYPLTWRAVVWKSTLATKNLWELFRGAEGTSKMLPPPPAALALALIVDSK